MTTRNLNYLFNPSSMAVIGKGRQPQAPDALLIRNMLRGDIKAPVMPVNPDRKALEGVLAYPDVSSLPMAPELAVITTPLDTVPGLINELGSMGTKAVVLLNGGSSSDQQNISADLIQAMLDAARPHLLRILGPDSLGMAAPKTGVNAILSDPPPQPGNIAVISQSAAITRSVIDWASNKHIGFSHVVSVGERVDVDFGDMLDYLAQDNQARAILMYLEYTRNARKFMSAARTAARMKPVAILRPHSFGGNEVGDNIYDAAFRRAGLLRVRTIEGLFRAAESVDQLKRVYNNRLAIMSNSSSLGLLAVDNLYMGGSTGSLATLSEETREAIDKIIPKGLSRDNPIDLGDQANPKSYGEVLRLLLKDRNNDGIVVLHAPVSHTQDLEAAHAVVDAAGKSRRAVLTCWLGGKTREPARRLFQRHNIVTYSSPTDMVQVFKRVAEYTANQELLMETPPSVPREFQVDTKRARQAIGSALAEGRDQLNPFEISDLMAAYGIPTVETRLASTTEEAIQFLEQLNDAVVLKIYSPDIAQKSDVSGVSFNLETAEELRESATAMLRRVKRLAPEAQITGFLVQPMLNRGNDYEINIGVHTGQRFGPVIYFGHGGTEKDVIKDIAYALPPLNMHLAKELMSRTRLYRMLSDTLGRTVDLDALALTLIKVSQMVIDFGEIVELDLNPLWAGHRGVIALDARVQIAEYTLEKPTDRLAICPYPKELEQQLTLPDGRALLVRPIMAEDEPAMQAMVRRSDPEDLRLRFFQPIKELTHTMAARLTQLDYDREMAFAITDPGTPGKADIWGVVRITADPNMERAEYAILLDRTMMGQGIGPMLMRSIIEHARKRGIKEIFGEVLRENRPMLKLNQALGFTVATDPEDRSLMLVSLKL